MACSALSERAVEVCLLRTGLGLPAQSEFVCEDACDQSGAVVSSKTDQHDSDTWHLLLCLNDVFLAHIFEAACLLVIKSESLVICGFDEVT